MTKEKIKQAFDHFHQLKVLIIGDVMIDSYLWGKVDRISPEAPVPIVTGIRKEKRLGGAANVALNIAALGAQPIICSVTGDDDEALVIANLMKKNGIDASGLIADPSRPTTIKTRIISASQHLMRIDEEVIAPVDSTVESKMYDAIKSALNSKRANAIIFEDYDKGCITPTLIASVINLAKSMGVPVLVDPKKRNYNDYKGANLFKPNLKEFLEGIKQDIPKTSFDQLKEAAKKYRETMNFDCLMITMADKGILSVTATEAIHTPVLEKIDIADVSGAGDTVISVVACCVASGMNPADVAMLANYAGGQVCEKPGVVPVDKEALLRKL